MKYRALATSILFATATFGLSAAGLASEHTETEDENGITIKKSDNWERFQELDIDNDGFISETEAAADKDLVKWFGRLDEDNDDRLSREEFAVYEPNGVPVDPSESSW